MLMFKHLGCTYETEEEADNTACFMASTRRNSVPQPLEMSINLQCSRPRKRLCLDETRMSECCVTKTDLGWPQTPNSDVDRISQMPSNLSDLAPQETAADLTWPFVASEMESSNLYGIVPLHIISNRSCNTLSKPAEFLLCLACRYVHRARNGK